MRQRGWTKVVLLIVAGAVCAGVSNSFASKERKLAWIGSYPRALETGAPSAGPAVTPETRAAPAPTAAPALPAAGSFPPHPDRASVEISTDDAEALFRQQRLFLDARRSSVYTDGHVSGARNFPVWESDIADRVKAFFEEGLDQNAPIVIYCSGGDCEDSHMLAEKLYMVGFNALYVDKDGFPAWQKRGLPVTKGPKP